MKNFLNRIADGSLSAKIALVVSSTPYAQGLQYAEEETIPIAPGEVIIVEGILIFTDAELCENLDLKVFVDTEADERLIRIIQRDVNERGRGLDKSIRHYEKFVKPMHETFIEPSKKFADIIIPIGGHNTKGIDILISKIRWMLHEA